MKQIKIPYIELILMAIALLIIMVIGWSVAYIIFPIPQINYEERINKSSSDGPEMQKVTKMVYDSFKNK